MNKIVYCGHDTFAKEYISSYLVFSPLFPLVNSELTQLICKGSE